MAMAPEEELMATEMEMETIPRPVEVRIAP